MLRCISSIGYYGSVANWDHDISAYMSYGQKTHIYRLVAVYHHIFRTHVMTPAGHHHTHQTLIPDHYYTILYSTILYYTILHCTVLYCTVLYCTVLYCSVLYYTILCYAVLGYAMLCYTILYYAIPYYTITYTNTLAHIYPFGIPLQEVLTMAQAGLRFKELVFASETCIPRAPRIQGVPTLGPRAYTSATSVGEPLGQKHIPN